MQPIEPPAKTTHRDHMPAGERGSALLLAVLIVAAISVVLELFLIRSDSITENFIAFTERKSTFHLTDGTGNLAVAFSQSYLREAPNPNNADLTAFLRQGITPLLPTSHSLGKLNAEIIASRPGTTIPNGPLAGLSADVSDIRIELEVFKSSGGKNIAVSAVDTVVSIGHVSLFQFLHFYQLEQMTLNYYPVTQVRGRLHINGDICLGGRLGTHWERVTASGRILNILDADCDPGAGLQDANAFIATSAGLPASARVTTANDHGCTNCEGSGMDWREYALSKWGGNALDVAHEVPKLMPVSAVTTPVQVQWHSSAVKGPSGWTSMRFLIDPPRAVDSQLALGEKFSHQSDIRIIDGVWFLRNPSAPGDWPGVPIWSDHPGHALKAIEGTSHHIAVGQADLNAKWGWSSVPHHYSFYEYDEINRALYDDTAGTVSYGSLFNTGAAVKRFIPGFFVDSATSGAGLCHGSETFSCPGGGCGLLGLATPGTCQKPSGSSAPVPLGTRILNATRSGFVDPHMRESGPGTPAQRDGHSRILPLNFDVAAFQQALRETGPGELGSYFGPGRFMKEDFNGIVYITTTWPGSLSAFGSQAASPLWPTQGNQNDPEQTGATAASVQTALPKTLCSDSNFSGANQSFDQKPHALFKIPKCSHYIPTTASGIAALPNAVRVVNGSILDPVVLKRGLSLVSNVPVYVTGDYNTSSDTSSVDAASWVAALIAADNIANLSNSWSDANARWHGIYQAQTRNASNTTYKTAFLSGLTTSLQEDWSGVDLNAIGSNVFVHLPVYWRTHMTSGLGNRTYDAPDRNYSFDPHFALLKNQPPGAPALPTRAVFSWKRD